MGIFLSLIFIVLSIGLGLLILLNNYRSKINILYFLNALCLASWSFILILLKTYPQEIYIKMAFPPTILLAFFLYLFTLYFPKALNINTTKISLLFIPAPIFIYFSLFTDLFVKEYSVIKGVTNVIRGSAYIPFLIYFLIFCILAVTNIIRKYPHLDRNNKTRTKIFLSGIILTMITGTLTNLILPALGLNDYVFLGAYSIVFYMFFAAYAIIKHELLDIRLAITRTVSYGFVASGILLSIIFSYTSLTSFPVIQLLTMITLCFLWSFISIPLSNFLVTTAKRKFIRGYYEADKVISKLSNELAIESDREKIIKCVESTLNDAFELERTSIIVAIRDQQNNHSHYLLIDKESDSRVEIEKNNPLIQYIKNQTSYLIFDNLDSNLTSLLKENGFKYKEQCLLIPINSPEILESVIILGKRSSQKKYTNKDYDFIKQITTYVSAIFYKLTPYEKIEKAFNDNQRKVFEMEKQLERSGRIESSANAWKQWPHEIKTPLSIIKLATEDIETLSDFNENKETILNQISRCQRVVENMLTLNRTSSTVEEIGQNLHINSIIKESLKYVPSIENIDIKLELSEEMKISCIQDDVISVFTNIIVNAQQVMPEGGKITINTSIKNKMALIKISDTGPGIPEELKTKIWDPFYTTNIGTHRGLGLSLVAKIMKDHKGIINFESEIDKGTTFVIEFPIVEQ